MLELFARHGDFDLTVDCDGDTDVDFHHSVEDIGIVLGQTFNKALGDKRGICRYGQFLLPMTEYRETVLRLRREYEGRMEILLGLEWDSVSDVSPAGFDYWIGSVHHLQNPDTGVYYTVDWKPESLAKCCVELFHGCFPALIGQYYADVAAVAAKKPTILGHFDLITKLNGDGELFDEDDRHYRSAALASLRQR